MDEKEEKRQNIEEALKLLVNIKDDEINDDKKRTPKIFSEVTKIFTEDILQTKKDQDKEIEYHDEYIRTLESLPQESKLEELKRNEIILLDILKKESLLLDKFYSLFTNIKEILTFLDSEDISSFSERKSRIQNEINTISEDLKERGIIK